jgi:hypothetical protein
MEDIQGLVTEEMTINNMGFNKRYIDKDRIVYAFGRRGILGVRELIGLEGLGKIEAIITMDDFSDRVVTAYQEGKENDVAMEITDGVIKKNYEKNN